MPLTSKGVKLKKKFEQEYGPEKGEQVFYASENAGRIKGITKDHKAKTKAIHKKLKVKHTNKGRAGNISYLGR